MKRLLIGILKSKTIWFNILTLGLAAFGIITDQYPIDPKLLLSINGIGNLFLRALTTRALSEK